MDAIAIAKVTEFTCVDGNTKGKYQVIKSITAEEKKAFDMYLHLK